MIRGGARLVGPREGFQSSRACLLILQGRAPLRRFHLQVWQGDSMG